MGSRLAPPDGFHERDGRELLVNCAAKAWTSPIGSLARDIPGRLGKK
jgi:hypothetical protein